MPGGRLIPPVFTGKIVFLAYGPGLNAIVPKVLPLRPLALMLVAGSLTRSGKTPRHEASVSVRQSSAGERARSPAVFAVRTKTAGALFAQEA